MSAIMLKVLADFLKVTPDDITKQFEQMRDLASNGVNSLEQINARLARIERALNIEQIDGQDNANIIDVDFLERQNHDGKITAAE